MRTDQQHGMWSRGLLAFFNRRRAAQYHMPVCATKTEAADARVAHTGSGVPGDGLPPANVDMAANCSDMWVFLCKIEVRHILLVIQHQRGFHHAQHTRRRLQMANVGFN